MLASAYDRAMRWEWALFAVAVAVLAGPPTTQSATRDGFFLSRQRSYRF